MPLEEIADMIREACGLTTPVEDALEVPSSVPTTPVCPVCGGTIRASRPDKGMQGGHSAVYDIAQTNSHSIDRIPCSPMPCDPSKFLLQDRPTRSNTPIPQSLAHQRASGTID